MTSNSTEGKPQTRIMQSIGWSVLSRWASKAIGMVNTIILARLLSPEDFGIVAMATIVLTLLDSLTQIGVHLFVIRQKDDDVRVFNAAWTVNLIQAFVIALVLSACAPWISSFYGEEALVNIIYCLALVRLLAGLENFGIFIAQKQLRFDIDFKITFLKRLSYLVATATLAFILENYWALVFGQIVSGFFGIILSYWLHPFRPRLSLFQWREMLKYSSSTLPMSIGRFVNNQLDVAVIGKVSNAQFLGGYHIASNLAGLFTKELLIPFIKGLLPNLSKVKESPQFNDFYRMIVSSALYLFLPVGIGLSLVSTEFVHVLLGPKWLEAAPLLSMLCIYMMISGLMMFISEQFMIILGKESLSNKIMWLRNLALVIAITVAVKYFHYTDIPLALVISSLISFPFVLLIVTRSMGIGVWFLVKDWFPALSSILLMYITLQFSPWPEITPFLLLPIKVLVGGIVYVSGLSFFYLARGKPDNTPEHLFLKKVLKKA